MRRNISLAVVAIFLLSSCATTPSGQPGYLKILYGADTAYDAAMSACASSYNSHLIAEVGKARCIELGGYYVVARANVVAAIELYNTTHDAAVLDQITYWTSYALGIAAQIIDVFNQAKVGA